MGRLHDTDFSGARKTSGIFGRFSQCLTIPCFLCVPTLSSRPPPPSTSFSPTQPQPATQSPSLLFHPPTPKIPPSSAPGSIDHFRNARQLNLLRQPSSHISIPVHAIMAALSVQSSWGGKSSSTCSKPRASRKARSLHFGQLHQALGFGPSIRRQGRLRRPK